MSALALIMTTAGLTRFTAAQVDDDIDLGISEVGFTDQQFVVAPTLTALPGEIKRVDTISGQAIGGNMVHMTVRDDSADSYEVRGFGLFLADGTLFAVYGQADPIMVKSAQAALFQAIDIAFPTADIENLTFGNTDFLNPPATTETKGVVELATQPEAEAGVDPFLVITCAVLKAMLDGLGIDAAIAAVLAHTVNVSGLLTGGGAIGGDPTIGLSIADLEAAGFRTVVDEELGSNGYRIWSDGLIEQWGVANVTTEATTTITYPVAHTIFSVPVGSASVPAADEQNIGVAGAGTASFTVYNGNPSTVPFRWHSFGR